MIIGDFMKRLFLLCLILLSVTVSAEKATVNKDYVWIKSRPESSIKCFNTAITSECINRLNIRDGSFDVLKRVKVNDPCPNWSEISYKNMSGQINTGFICDNDLTFIKEAPIEKPKEENNPTQNYSNKYGKVNKDRTWFYPSPFKRDYCDNLNEVANGCVNRLDINDPAFKINYKVKSLDNTCTEYYHITFANKRGAYTEGFICTSLVSDASINEYAGYKAENIKPSYFEDTSKYSDAEYLNYLTRQGFPSDYHTPLLNLHKKYPKWQFSSFVAPDNFFDTVKEFTRHGRVTIRGNLSGNGSYLKTDGSFYNQNEENRLPINVNVPYYNYLTDTFAAVEGSSWYQMNAEAIAYFMDPRNYLNESAIFSFIKNNYDPERDFSSTLDTLIGKQSTLYQQKDVILKAAKDFGASPAYIAAQIIQETGRNGSVQTSGDPFLLLDGKTKVSGYYNYFNINAYGNDAAIKGLRYAYDVSWDTRERAIRAGTAFISGAYIVKGQYTPYTTKYNVHPLGKNLTGYGHGYMADAMAPLSAGGNIKKAYKDANNLNDTIFFEIPVYKNMPAKIQEPRYGNPNNYLKDLKINNKVIANFNPNVTDYTYQTKDKEINISATPIVGKASVKGTGKKILNYKEETITIKVEAENGKIRNYNIKVIKEELPKEPDNPVVPDKPSTNKTYLIKGNYIYNLGLNKYKDAFLKEEPKAIINGPLITTGTDIKIGNKTYKAVIYGDINGDNAINLIDMLILKKHLLNYQILKDYKYEAADLNKDGVVNLIDLIIIKKHILGYKNIRQA